jgi:hypothetical protein
MAIESTTINLHPAFFKEHEQLLATHGSLQAYTFRYESGVCALRLKNELGELVMLPFQGQQIWFAEFYDRNLTMKSMFDEPRPTRQYLANYGGFFIHCGATAMGGPSQEDTHPLHGELPNAPFQKAYLQAGEDERGSYLALGGQYQHTVAFACNYLAEPLLKFYSDSGLLWLSMDIRNLKNSSMEFMYLAHINFRPVDHGRLVYSAIQTPQHIRVRTSIPSHIQPSPSYVTFLEELKAQPELHHTLNPGLMFDPEVVFYIDYLADNDGWAHTLHIHPDGNADYVRHRPAQLDQGIRWICRTPDQDALGMSLPATAEPEGYLAEKAKGNVKTLPPGGVFHFEVEMGALPPPKARKIESKIEKINSGAV